MTDLANALTKGSPGQAAIDVFDVEPLPKDDPTRRQPDISLAKRELGWEPKVDLDTGLKKTIADFEERLRSGEEPR
jgi:UDP-glucuronate decarboxylase